VKLENKKALVTGASRGIGRAIADCFLAEGAEVWGIGTKKPDDGDIKGMIEKANGKFHWVSADLSELDKVETVIDDCLKQAGGFDILVNNAGITKDNLSFRMSFEEWQKVMDINLSAAFFTARTVARDMIRKRSGTIINMTSVVGLHGNGGQANYAASKAGLIGVTKSLAREIAGRGVRVNAVAPGFIETDMTAALGEKVKESVLAQIPLARIGKPSDVAQAVLFLASDDSAYITGQVITVDGGMFI